MKRKLDSAFSLNKSVLFGAILLISISFMLYSPLLIAQNNNIKFQHLSVENGLSQNTIRLIYQDKKGFLYFGTELGLNKYNGYGFKVDERIGHFSINVVVEDKTGDLWIGTTTGLIRIENKTKKRFFYTGRSEDSTSILANHITSIMEDPSGNVWIGTLGGLNRYNREKDNFERVFLPGLSNLNVVDNYVNSLLIDKDSSFWIGTTQSGILRYDLIKQDLNDYRKRDSHAYKFELIEHHTQNSRNSTGFGSDHVNCIFRDKDGIIWIGTDNQGLKKAFPNGKFINTKSNKSFASYSFKHYKNDRYNKNSISSNNITTIYEDKTDNFWIGTYGGGLNKFNRNLEKWSSYLENPLDPAGINSNYVLSIFEDRSNNLWVGTYNAGVNKYCKNRKNFQLIKSDKKINGSLGSDLIASIFEDRDGNLWAGTRDGLNKFEPQKKEWLLYKNDPDLSSSLSSNMVRAICEDDLGYLWLGTNGGGLNMFDKNNETFICYLNDLKNPNSLSNNSIRPMIIDRNKNLWIGTSGGLNKFNIRKRVFERFITLVNDSASISNSYIWSIYEDKNGNIWVATRLGINKYNSEDNNFLRIDFEHSYRPANASARYVMSMCEDTEGTIWLGTFGSGMHKIISEEIEQTDNKGNIVGKRKIYKEIHYHINFLSDEEVIYAILPDDNSNLWFSSNHGIWKYNPKTQLIKNYTISDGLQADEFNSGAFFKNSKGEMFFGGNNGFNRFHPRDIIDNENVPNIVITGFRKFDSTVRFDADISDVKLIDLSYRENFFSFEFASLDYSNPQKNQYAYMLEGFDQDWVYCGTRNYASYTNLDGGEYIFRVRGSNNDGKWNYEGISIKVLIHPPYWNTWWFQILLVMMLVGLVFLGIKYRVKRIKLINKELENLVSIRTGELNQKTSEVILQKIYFQQLFENTPLGVAMLDGSNRIVAINKSYEQIFGYKIDDILNKSIDDVVVPGFLKEEANFVSIETAGDKIFEIEAYRKRKDDSLIYVHIYGLPIKIENKTAGVYAIYEDITERKRIEDETKKRTEQIILHQSTLLNLTKYDNSSLLETMEIVSEACSKTLDIERASIWLYNEDKTKIICQDMFIKSKNLHVKGTQIDPDKYRKYLLALEKSVFVADDAQADSFISEFTEYYLKPKGITSMLGVSIRHKGNLIGVIRFEQVDEKKKWTQEEQNFASSVSDLISLSLESDARRRAEEELASEKERLSITLRSIGDGVITTDINGNVVLMNKVAEDLTGWLQEESVGKSLMDVFNIINERTGLQCENPFEKIINSGIIINLESHTVLVSKKGRERVISDSGAPIRDKESRIIGVVLVFRDITDRQRMEEEITKTQKLESLGILAGGIAHDFNNFLTSILGNISLAKMYSKNDAKVSNRLLEAEKASLRAKDLTQQLLTFSKGGAPIKKIILIENLLRETVSFTLSGSKVSCDFEIDKNLLPVNCDEGQISQVISNLIINADQAMPEGGTIQVIAKNFIIKDDTVNPYLKPGNYVKISIKDHGVGIPEEQQQKIFDPFYTTKQKGRGLGLATVFSILQKHNGYIDVDSEVGYGATFNIYLPSSDDSVSIIHPLQDQIKYGKGKILLMDDDEMVREFAKELISDLGYEIILAKNGEETIEIFNKEFNSKTPFDLIILDLTIPGGLGGKEVIKVLKAKNPDIKAIVSSGYSNDPVMSGYKDYGFLGVIPKPYKSSELSQIISKVLNNI